MDDFGGDGDPQLAECTPLELRAEGEISDEVLRKLERELDLEE